MLRWAGERGGGGLHESLRNKLGLFLVITDFKRLVANFLPVCGSKSFSSRRFVVKLHVGSAVDLAHAHLHQDLRARCQGFLWHLHHGSRDLSEFCEHPAHIVLGHT